MPGSSSEVREAQISGFLKMRENTENPQKATIFPFENESIKSWHKRVEIGIEVHFKGWNLCRKFLTNRTAIKNSTHHSQIALWVAAKPWKTNQISRFRRASNLTWRVMGWDIFSGTFADRGSSTCFLTFLTIQPMICKLDSNAKIRNFESRGRSFRGYNKLNESLATWNLLNTLAIV